jgi:hypothetical protein
VSTIGERVLGLHHSLDEAQLPHAFGGALALAWCTAQPRGTSDIDLNVFVPPGAAAEVVAAMPDGVECPPERVQVLERDGQVRLRWDITPVDIFLSTTPFHDEAAGRARVEPFLGAAVPFLACADVAVFKVFFNRTRDWADLEDMAAAGTIDRTRLREMVVTLLGPEDKRLDRVDQLPW